MTNELHPLTTALIAEQERLKLNNERMAAKLGITASAWSLTKRGLRAPGTKVVTGALQAFKRINVAKMMKEE
jgi:hypothetical protein